MKTAVITGASRGLGAEMALKLGQMGYQVALSYLRPSSKPLAEAVAAQITRQYGMDAFAFESDVASYDSCRAFLDAAAQRFGPELHALVNNAGITNNLSYTRITCPQYSRLLAVDLMGTMHMCHLALPRMLDHDACVVNISSVNGLTPSINQADYCAAKAGVIGLTRALALEYAQRRLRVNAIAPGLIMTDMVRGVNQEELRDAAATIPMGYIGQPADVAGCLEYILTARYLTGQTISPNGGFVMP